MNNQEEILLHFGKKGMRWGVRNRIKAEIGSAKREYGLTKNLRDTSKLSDDQLKSLSERVGLENSLKSLSTGRKAIGLIRTKRMDRREYLERGKMSDADLKKRVARLQLEDALAKQVGSATKTQREIGTRVVQSALNIAISTMIAKQPLKSAIMKEIKSQGNTKQATPVTPGSIATSFVTNVKKPKKEEPVVKHSAEGEEILQHFGKLGMRWGVRNVAKAIVDGNKNSLRNNPVGLAIRGVKKLGVGGNTGHQASIKNKHQGILGKQFKTKPINKEANLKAELKAELKADKKWDQKTKKEIGKKIVELSRDKKLQDEAIKLTKNQALRGGITSMSQLSNVYTINMSKAMNQKLGSDSKYTSPSGKAKVEVLISELNGQLFLAPRVTMASPKKKP